MKPPAFPKILFVIACFLCACAFGLLLLANHYWCSKIDVISVFYDSEKFDDSSLYQCSDDSLVLLVNKDGRPWADYIILPSSRRVGGPNASNFYETRFGLIARKMPIDATWIGEVQAKNDDIQPNLLIEPNLIEFSTGNDRKISIRK